MGKLAVQLPDSLRPFLDAQVSAGRAESADEYVCELVERERKKAELREKISAGIEQLERGEIGTMTREEIKAEGRKRLEQKKLNA